MEERSRWRAPASVPPSPMSRACFSRPSFAFLFAVRRASLRESESLPLCLLPFYFFLLPFLARPSSVLDLARFPLGASRKPPPVSPAATPRGNSAGRTRRNAGPPHEASRLGWQRQTTFADGLLTHDEWLTADERRWALSKSAKICVICGQARPECNRRIHPQTHLPLRRQGSFADRRRLNTSSGPWPVLHLTLPNAEGAPEFGGDVWVRLGRSS